MDDLIDKITSKVGISADQAKGAINTVMEHIGDKLPAPIASQVNKFLGEDAGSGDDDGNGGGDDGGLLGQAKDALGGLLGG